MKHSKQIVWIIALVAGSTAVAQQPARMVLATSSLDMQATEVSMGGGGQVKDDLFAGTEKFAKNAKEVSEINLDPKMMGMVGGHGSDSEMAHKMNFIVIHSYTYEKPGMYSMDEIEVYRKKLTDGSWNCSIHVREKESSTDICARTGPDHESNEMVILAAEPKELTFIHMSGRMPLEELGKMGGGMGSGMGHGGSPHRAPLPPVTPAPPLPPANPSH